MSTYISEVVEGNKSIKLTDNQIDINKNIITVIIGNNGSGKSRLLKTICYFHILSYLDERDIAFPSYRNDRNFLSQVGFDTSIIFNINGETNKVGVTNYSKYGSNNIIDINANNNSYKKKNVNKIKKIIAISTSPFDKFPIMSRRNRMHFSASTKNYYRYFGARTENRNSEDYLKSKFNQLGSSIISFFLGRDGKKANLIPLFNYLGLNTTLTLITSIPFPLDFVNDNNRDINETRKSILFFKNEEDPDVLSENEKNIINTAIEKFKNFISRDNNRYNRSETLNFTIDINNISIIDDIYNDLSILSKYDLIEVSNIEFTKKENNKNFLLTDASSGELCTLFTIIAIAGEIDEDTIVLIDEPELSLHPAWQYSFMPLINSVFHGFNGCHFIIATHSPQIISSLEKTNSFIVTMDDKESKLYSASKYFHRSSDYQLAKIFNFPGYRNEYLLNEAIELLSLISENEKIDNDVLRRSDDIIKLLNLLEDKNDPVYKLINTIKKAMEIINK